MAETKILIVEDETIVAKNIEKRLISAGYKVTGLSITAEDAITKISTEKPDLVLMDIKLKGKMDGIEASNIIRKSHHLPVIFLTSYTDDETFQKAKITEPFGYLIKPIDIKELNRVVEIALYKNRINNELLKNEEKFRHVFESSGIGMAIVNPDGQFTKVNEPFCEIIGYNEKKIIEKNIRDITHPGDLDRSLHLLHGLLSHELNGSQHIEKRYIHKNGEIIWAITTISLVRDYEGKPLYFLVQVQDITQRKKAEDQLAKYAEELKTLNRSKDKFFSIISHDLRSPFNSLLGVTEYMSQYYKEMSHEEIKDSIMNIYKSSQKVYNLILNLLEWSRLQSGRLEVDKTTIDMKEIGDEITGLYKETAKSKQINLSSNITEDVVVYADRYMIETVMRNLVSNSIKFTPQNGIITINASIKSQNKMVEIAITDTGIGISKENQQKLFRIDEQYRREGTADEKGTGLGLILCKEFIEKNGGTISVESDEGKGSRFIFTIPLFTSKEQ